MCTGKYNTSTNIYTEKLNLFDRDWLLSIRYAANTHNVMPFSFEGKYLQWFFFCTSHTICEPGRSPTLFHLANFFVYSIFLYIFFSFCYILFSNCTIKWLVRCLDSISVNAENAPTFNRFGSLFFFLPALFYLYFFWFSIGKTKTPHWFPESLLTWWKYGFVGLFAWHWRGR